MKVKTGSYVGTGSAQSITGVGFAPSAVLVQAVNQAQPVIGRLSGMSNSKQMHTNTAFEANLITSFDADGFSVGTAVAANQTGITFLYVCLGFSALADFDMFSYVGDGADNRNLDILTFQPDFLVIVRSGAAPVWRSASMAGDQSFNFSSAGSLTNRIQAFRALGFQVGTDVQVNESGVTYYGLAAQAVSNLLGLKTYVGNGSDNRNISGLGLSSPAFVTVQRSGFNHPVLRQSSVHTGDQSAQWISGTVQADRIQALLADGFQVGTDVQVNFNTNTYFAFGFQDGASNPVTAGSKLFELFKRRRWIQRDKWAPFL